MRCECCGHTEDLRGEVYVTCRDASACLRREAERQREQRADDARRLPTFGWRT